MTRRILLMTLVLGVCLCLGSTSASAKGRCRAVLVDRIVCEDVTDGIGGRQFALADRECHQEGKRCSREGDQCETLYAEVECYQGPEGNSGTERIGLGCFCGGGSVTTVRPSDPVSADEFLRLLRTIEAYQDENDTCEAPPELTAQPAVQPAP